MWYGYDARHKWFLKTYAEYIKDTTNKSIHKTVTYTNWYRVVGRKLKNKFASSPFFALIQWPHTTDNFNVALCRSVTHCLRVVRTMVQHQSLNQTTILLLNYNITHEVKALKKNNKKTQHCQQFLKIPR